MRHPASPRRRLIRSIVGLPFLLALVAAPVAAQTWAEAGDAGELVGTAQVTSGNGLFTAITGELSQHGDVDIYCLQLLAVPPMNQPLAGISCAMNSEPSLYLFDAAGVGVDANMSCMGGMKLVAASGSMTPGFYYLAVAHGDWLPMTANGLAWSLTYSGHLAPNGPGAGWPLTGWVGPLTFVSAYPYQLNLYSNWVGWCELATAEEAVTWGALKATFGN